MVRAETRTRCGAYLSFGPLGAEHVDRHADAAIGLVLDDGDAAGEPGRNLAAHHLGAGPHRLELGEQHAEREAEQRRESQMQGEPRPRHEGQDCHHQGDPALENIETLTRQVRRRGQQADFQGAAPRRARGVGRDRSGAALRPDRAAGARRRGASRKLPRFFKRYQIQPVWRADRPARGRFREFYQCDVDAIGSTSPVVEAELLRRGQRRAAASSGSPTSSIRLNHRGLLRGMLETSGVPAGTARPGAGRASTSWTRSAATGVRAELAARGIGADGDAPMPRSSFDGATHRIRPARVDAPGRATGRRHRRGWPRSRTWPRSSGSSRRPSAGRARALDPQPGARAVVLHRRDHGDRGAGSRRQPRRRRPLRRPDRHVPRARRCRRAASRSGSSGSSS